MKIKDMNIDDVAVIRIRKIGEYAFSIDSPTCKYSFTPPSDAQVDMILPINNSPKIGEVWIHIESDMRVLITGVDGFFVDYTPSEHLDLITKRTKNHFLRDFIKDDT